MIAKSPEEHVAELEIYTYLRRKILWREQLRQRVEFLKQNPGAITLDDFDALRDHDGRTRRGLFEVVPELREQYEEYLDSPEQVLGSLHEFMRRAYRHCKLGGTFLDNWHLKALCQEWQDLLEGKIERLMVNQPPHSTKSLISNVMVPAYAFAKDAGWSCIQISYNDALPRRDGQILLRLMQSDWYRRRFPHVQINSFKENYFTTTAGGFRRGSSVGTSITGWHPRLICIDDPSQAAHVTNSPVMLQKVISWYAATVPSRGMASDKDRRTAVAIVMQRLATNDLCGAILNEGMHGGTDQDEAESERLKGGFAWRHVCLPMFFDPLHPYRYEHDIRTEEGEILISRLSRDDIEARIREFEMDPEQGGKTTQAQFQQNPLFSQGSIFEGLDYAYIGRNEYINLRLFQGKAVRCWDRADSLTGDDTAGVLVIEKDGIRYVADVVVFKKRYAERDNLIEQVALQDRDRFSNYRVACEKVGGPDGNQAFDTLYARLAKLGIETMAIPVSTAMNKSKEYRAQPVAGKIKHGMMKILGDKPWRQKFHTQLRLFPNGKNDDIVDGLSGADWALTQWGLGKV